MDEGPRPSPLPSVERSAQLGRVAVQGLLTAAMLQQMQPAPAGFAPAPYASTGAGGAVVRVMPVPALRRLCRTSVVHRVLDSQMCAQYQFGCVFRAQIQRAQHLSPSLALSLSLSNSTAPRQSMRSSSAEAPTSADLHRQHRAQIWRHATQSTEASGLCASLRSLGLGAARARIARAAGLHPKRGKPASARDPHSVRIRS